MRQVIVAAVALLVAALAGPAVATGPAWTSGLAPVPSGTTPTQTAIAHPSCWDASHCVTTGYVNTDGASFATLTQRAGNTVTTILAPQPANSSGNGSLHDVACAAAGACVAVGQYTTKAGSPQGFLDTLANGVWTAQQAVLHIAGAGYLDAVDCNATMCAAIGGFYDRRGGPYPLVYDQRAGTAWQSRPFTYPDAAHNTVTLTSVSCPRTGLCAALADTHYVTGHLLVYPSGSGWKGVYTPLPPNAGGSRSQVGNISCATAGNCAALETWYNDDNNLSGVAAITLTDGVLATQSVALPDGAGPDLIAPPIDCAGAMSCAGVVQGGTATEREQILVRRTGSTWSTSFAPSAPDGDVSILLAISCGTRTTCTAVGESGLVNERSLAVSLADGVWSAAIVPDPLPAAQVRTSVLLGVDCATARCTATGELTLAQAGGPTRGIYAVGP